MELSEGLVLCKGGVVLKRGAGHSKEWRVQIFTILQTKGGVVLKGAGL